MLSTKVVLVTGGSRGIGASISRRMADEGYAVAINYVERSDTADALVKELNDEGKQALAIKCDVSQADDVNHMFNQVEATLGKIDVLINNAGIMALAKIEDSHEDLFDKHIAINLKGTFNTLKEASSRLEKGGRIINLSSSVTCLKPENYGVYAATKSAIETLTCILSKELSGKEITVNAVAPGPTTTDLFLKGKSEEQIQSLAKRNPMQRLGTPTDIANLVAFLASAQGSWINGQILKANGGMI